MYYYICSYHITTYSKCAVISDILGELIYTYFAKYCRRELISLKDYRRVHKNERDWEFFSGI